MKKDRLNFIDLDLNKIAQTIEKQNSIISSGLAGIQGIEKIAETISKQIGQYDRLNSSLNQTIESAFKNPEFISRLNSWGNLNRELSIQFSNEEVLKSITRFTFNSQRIINDFDKITKSLNFDGFGQINTVNVAISGLSKTLIKDIAREDSWSDLDYVNSANEELLDISEPDLIASPQEILDYRDKLLSHLQELILKAKSPKVVEFLWKFMNLASFVLSAYSAFVPKPNHTTLQIQIQNPQNVQVMESKFENFKLEIEKKLDEKLANLDKQRIAKTNVNLRFSSKKNSKKLGLVKKGQIINVVEIRHKWLLIMYIDVETGEPKSGFVFKKYFQKI
ncbi:SH3 domain-containing protein [Salegentibacter salarius]|uniref:SH3b domain-containing protein n=1 Tax=Salegentibacter salarius TaxID=435906 RepID=A0A2N0TQE6_9FLAO|nr:SH3 domain-containing protein [Salegentibacter salarius]OEY71729.1 hypothetical protein BHS39_15060 [Salegentibacter salarius]PKD16965.1 hypothetical protein APR40_15030 [Salegentibacter salarius]SLJ89766.1 hypothetical protein SAMN05660445_00864 [Salegentibacter salarius]